MTDPILDLPTAVHECGALPMPVGNPVEPLSDERLAEIQGRVDIASSGPWGTHRDLAAKYSVLARPRSNPHGFEDDGVVTLLADGRSDAESYANASFIANSREDVPALLAEVARLKADLRAERQRVAALKDTTRQLLDDRRTGELLNAVQSLEAERDEVQAETVRLAGLLGERDAEVERLSGRASAAGEYFRRAETAEAEVKRLTRQRSFLVKQIQKKDARSGEADAAVRRFLQGDSGGEGDE